jgi:ligand-binding sensor domain-containing protein
MVVTLIYTGPAHTTGNWTNFTSSDYVRDAAKDGDTLWCATLSGLVKWNLRDSTYVKYTTIEGLPEIECQSVAVDSSGVVWVAHAAGVATFDGVSFTDYRQAYGFSLGGANDIEITSDNHVWISGYGGVACYYQNNWTVYRDEAGIQGNVYDIEIEPSGLVWIASATGLFAFDGTTWHKYSKENVLPYTVASAVERDMEGNIWVATYEYPNSHEINSLTAKTATQLFTGTLAAISRFDGTTWVTYDMNSQDSYQTIRRIHASGDTLWVALTQGIIPLNRKMALSTDPTNSLFNLNCFSILDDRDGDMWFCTISGLYRYVSGALVSFPMNAGMCRSCVNDLAVDDKGHAWIATPYGVSCFNGSQWRSYYEQDGLFSNNVLSIAVGPNGFIWTSHNDGISWYDGYSWQKKQIYRVGSEIAVDSNGTVWAGSLKGSLIFRYNGTDVSTYTIPGELWHNPLNDIIFDKRGDVWCATESTGIVRLSLTNGQPEWEFLAEKEGLPSPHVRAITFDKSETLWAATDNGLAYYENGFRLVTSSTPYYGAVKGAPDGSVWSGSTSGLSHFNGKEWITFTQKDGLLDNHITDIAFSPDGTVWAATQFYPVAGGLSRFIPDRTTSAFTLSKPAAILQIAMPYPNPFNPSTVIRYELGLPGRVTLTVFNALGQQVRRFDLGRKDRGAHEYRFDGSKLTSGVYFYRVETEKAAATGKMLLVR